MAKETGNSFKELYSTIMRMASLHIDAMRLTAAEKLTLLFGAIALYSVALVLAMVVLVFIAIGIASVLADHIAIYWSYFIVAGFYSIVIALLFVFRTQLFINPIARFVSRLLVKPPKA